MSKGGDFDCADSRIPTSLVIPSAPKAGEEPAVRSCEPLMWSGRPRPLPFADAKNTAGTPFLASFARSGNSYRVDTHMPTSLVIPSAPKAGEEPAVRSCEPLLV